jgi:hypothetical protein
VQRWRYLLLTLGNNTGLPDLARRSFQYGRSKSEQPFPFQDVVPSEQELAAFRTMMLSMRFRQTFNPLYSALGVIGFRCELR